MNVGQATRDEMRQWAAHGRMGSQAVQPRVTLDFPRRGERGQEVRIKWRASFAQRAVLRISPPGGPATDQEVPLIGHRSLRLTQVGQYAIEVIATPPASRGVGRRRGPSRSARATIDVIAPKPIIRLDGPKCITFGIAAAIRWTVTEAESVRLLIDGELHSAEVAGIHELELATCGQHVVALVAIGEGGQAEQALVIQVVAPPVTINAPTQAIALLGDMARFRYFITGARRAWLDPMDQREPAYSIPLVGRIEAPAALEPERVRLVAEGHDGRRTHKTITVSANFFDEVSFEEEITFLNGGLRQ
jgi:hypothetical protein